MELPKSLKKAMALTGIAAGLTSVSFAADQKREKNPQAAEVTVDVSKLPRIFDPSSGNSVKRITPAMLEAADKVCHAKHLFLDDSVTVEAVDGGTSVTTNLPCGEAHSAVHGGASVRAKRVH